MNYSDSVRFLYSLGNELKVGAKWGLERMAVLLKRLGHPERLSGLVHVAGTNGKGSTSLMIASALQHSGKRTGLFTSPHLILPAERIQIDGEPVSDEEFALAFNLVHKAAQALEADGLIDAYPSYFETVTAMAFCVFAGRIGLPPCEASVIEVGLGGRLDATNVIHPQLTVITPISFDHESFLGNTLESIAGEKAGIIKANIPVITAPQDSRAAAVLQAKAESANAPLLPTSNLKIAGESFSQFGCRFTCEGDEYTCPLPGRHQLQNAAAALAACRELHLPVPAIQAGLANAGWPGRLEYIGKSPAFLLDGAHNPAGAAALASYIQEFLRDRPVWMIYGTMRDKAIEEVCEILFPLADHLILTAPDMPRALRPETLADVAARPDAKIADHVAAAIALAKAAPPQATVIITGSLFLVGEARAILLRRMKLLAE